MPVTHTFNWADAGTNGDYSVGSGDTTLGVSVETTTNSAGQTGSIRTIGSPAEETFWVSGITEPVTTTLTFDNPVQNISFELFDLDQNTGSWDDQVTILATDAAGNIFPVSYSDLDGLHSVDGNTVNADGNASFGVETSGAEDSVTVDIVGPIVSLEITFEDGESAANTGVIGISEISFSPAPDGLVEGTAAAEVIDLDYLDDPEGDLVTTGADTILAGDGDDTVRAEAGDDRVLGEGGHDLLVGGEGDDTLIGGEGNDTLLGDEGDDVFHGGAGNDSVETGSGNDLFYGDEGDDRVNGDLGNDTLHGGTGDDFLRGSYGNDEIHSGGTGEGDDYLWGGYGDDRFVIADGFGNDTISGESIDEVDGDTIDLSAVTTGVTVDMTSGANGIGSFTDGTDTTVFEEIENIELSAGQDTVLLADGSGADTVSGFEAPTDNGDGTYTPGDLIDVSAMTVESEYPVSTRDVEVTEDGDGNAVLNFPGGETLTLEGVSADEISDPAALEALGIPAAPDGIVSGTENNDTFNIGDSDEDGDRIDSNDAVLPGTEGDDDVIQTFGGDDLVYSGAGDDRIELGSGNDTVHASVGNDTIFGGAGEDSLYGEGGDDHIYSGDGADLMNGGTGTDRFYNLSDGDTVYGGESEGDADTIDLTGAGPLRVIYNEYETESGTIEFLDDDGLVTGTATFKEIENIIPCFTPGTMISTLDGLRDVAELSKGDVVLTRDNGMQEIQWIGERALSEEDLAEMPHLRPILIKKGALGNGLPDRNMMVSPNHRVLINDPKAELMLGEAEVLVAAKHLLDLPGVRKSIANEVRYIHFMFERHEIVLSDGMWTESFQPGMQAMAGLESAQREEIYTLFPELKANPTDVFVAARKVLRKPEARLLLS